MRPTQYAIPKQIFFAIVAILISAIVCGCAADAPTQTKLAQRTSSNAPLDFLPALKGAYFRLDSQAAGRLFHIYVRLPEGFDPAAKVKYPVVYILDGDSLFPLLAPEHLFLHYDEKLPEAVLVGIAYGGFDPAINKRDIDFSEPGAGPHGNEGGAAKFLQLLREELLPEIERRYPVDPAKRILVGQSRGGKFVLWSALQDPDLFWARIASNPSFAPGQEHLFADPSAHTQKDLNVIIASGTRDREAGMKNAVEWMRFWQGRNDTPWHVRHLIIEGGTHAASIGEVYRQSMTWLFREDIAREGAKK